MGEWVVFFSFSFFYCCSCTVVSIFPSLLSPAPPTPTSHPQSYPLWLCPWVLYTCSLMTLSLLSPVTPFPSPLVTVSLFFISMSLVIFYFLVCFVDQLPLIGEIIWYLSLTSWLTSLSITLSSSIHAVTKGRSSVLSAV